MTNEKPMLMQSDMVNAILRDVDPKTCTRRTSGLNKINEEPNQWQYLGLDYEGKYEFFSQWLDREIKIKCPYGLVGDKLWIREKQRVIDIDTRMGLKIIKVRYEADGTESNWLVYPDRLKGVPKIGKCLTYGGYRESSRLTLEITDLRAERLQDITEADAPKEGAPFIYYKGVATGPTECQWQDCATQGFEILWNSINEKRGLGWKFNPWVWVVEFKLIKGA